MSDGLIAIGGVSPRALFVAALAIAFVATILLSLAPILSELLLRFRARRLPSALSERLLEEWLAEVHAVENRFGKLTFAIALALAPTKSLVQDMDETSLTGLPILMDFADVKVPTNFPIRLFALALDQVIAFATLNGMARLFALMLSDVSFGSFLAGILWPLAVDVYFVQRFGGSPGKLLAKLRIVTMDGSTLTYKHAFLRIAPNLFFEVLFNIATIAIIHSTMTLAAFDALTPSAQQQLLRKLVPLRFVGMFFAAVGAWTLGDVIAFFASYERRPLHDRLAGTMVVRRAPTVMRPTDDGPPPKLEPLSRDVWN